MPDPFYKATAHIEKIAGVHRRAVLPTGATVELGVHGPVKAHYKLTAASDLPLPVDYIVAATGG